MPRLTEATRERRRKRIAAAAMACFARYGFAQTSMSDIIEESGMSSGSIYSHFSSKADLIRFTASELLGEADLFRALEGRDGHPTPADVLAGIFERIPEREMTQTLLQVFADAPRDDELAAVICGNITKIRDLIIDALAPWAHANDDEHAAALTEQWADAVLAALHGYVVRVAVDCDVDPAVLQANLVAGLRQHPIQPAEHAELAP